MKKVININFQGRVIPIEETAYDLLKQYVESLRKFFAKEEGRDEIINDIEGRIAELFSDILKKGSTCITDADVNIIINSIGRPEDFDTEASTIYTQSEQQEDIEDKSQAFIARSRLYRDENDKILGGVCAGIAHYLRIDPAIIRILFAIITFGGFGAGILIYILLWIVVPSQQLERTAIRKRLFRNPDDKVIAGVAGGIATYFNIATWIPRLVFALPLLAGIITAVFRNMFWDFDPFPSVLFGSFGSTLLIIYIILWIVIPEANSASEKLEMRGEKIDLNTIKNTIQEDLSNFKTRAEVWGKEVGAKAQQWSSEFSKTIHQKNQYVSSETGATASKITNRFGHAIGVMFKAFFLFIAGVIAFALLMTLIALIFSGVSIFPLKNYFLEGFWQNTLAWSTLLLFIGVPIIGLTTWLVRRIMGIRPGSRSLGYIFGGLWTIGLIAGVFLAALITRSFDADAKEKIDVAFTNPTSNKVIVKVAATKLKTYGRWFRMDGILNVTEDSLIINNVRFHIVKSPDTAYHLFITKYSAGSNEEVALNNVQQINYDIQQQDSILWLDRGFSVKKGTKFRNQRVIATLQIPVGKHILIDKSVARRLNWFSINVQDRDMDWENEWDDENWESNVEYVMTVGGLERINEKVNQPIQDEKRKEKLEDIKKELKDMEEKQKELEQKKLELLKDADSTEREQLKSTSPLKTVKKVEDTRPTVSVPTTNDEEDILDISPNPIAYTIMKVIR